MCAHLSITAILDLIPFVSRLKEMFFKWAVQNDYSRTRLKQVVEQHENQEIKSIISAFEHWDDLQNYGAPGVEMESVYCEMNTVLKVKKICAELNEVIIDVEDVNNIGDFI